MISAVVLRLESKLSSGFASAAVLTPACFGCTSTAMPVEVYSGGTRVATIPARASDISTPGTVTYHLTSRARTVSPKVMLHALPDLTTLNGHRAHGSSPASTTAFAPSQSRTSQHSLLDGPPSRLVTTDDLFQAASADPAASAPVSARRPATPGACDWGCRPPGGR